MLRPVIVGIDGSPESLAAAGWAAREAQRRDTALRLVHAWAWSPHPSAAVPSTTSQRQWAQRILREARDHLGSLYPHLHVEEAQIPGPAPAVLLEASSQGALLVLGSRGLNGFTGYLAGSVSLSLTARSTTPVALVRAGEQAADAHQLNVEGHSSTDTPYRAVLLGIDLAHPGDEAIAFAFEAAQSRGAAVQVLHGYRPPSIAATGRGAGGGRETAAEHQSALDALVQPWRAKYPRTAVTTSALRGRAQSLLLHAASDAGLLVLGRRDRPRSGPFTGPTIHAALHHVRCPMVVVPHA
ncbi:universal stress protein [Streptomyces durmitorensis]|uniref:Universal stress protein n=1 Tax=Streptomyces durmitorensis TaxID=319947 RepID=A0ABY4Q4X2_9ACTN|nr:universal stress protein [Streptomyces durmitorensis]UQT60704.1 universal stress protein [Streptomyces durmitorensis]